MSRLSKPAVRAARKTVANEVRSTTPATSPAAAAETGTDAPAPDAVSAFIVQSALLYRQGQIREALAVVMQALAVDPDNAVLLNHRGVFAARLGDAAAAEAAYRRAIAVQPDFAETHYNLGNLLKAQQRPEEAEAAYRCAIAAMPDYAEACCNLGNLLQEQHRAEEAEATYRHAITVKPDYANTYSNLGNLLQAQLRPQEAEAAYRRAIVLRPDYAEAHSNLGVLLKAQQRPKEAEAAYQRAITVKPTYAEAWSNLGVLLMEQKRHEEAEAACRRAIAVKPDYLDAFSNLGNLLQAQKRPQQAEAAYRHAITVNPDHAEARWNLSLLLLKQGRFTEGWRAHEARYAPGRKNRKMAPPPTAPGGAPLPPQWQGQPLADKSMLVWPEQGLGDEIQFVRYLPLLKARGLTHLTLACKPPLKALFASQTLADRVIDAADWRPEMAAEFDFWCYPLSLPLHFETTLDNLPATIPYLTAEPDRMARWATRLPQAPLRVGLVWKGSPTHRNDSNRSLSSLATLAPLWAVTGVAFVSLQKGAGEDEARAPSANQPLTHLGSEMADFADSAAILSQLDLLICVDTAIAHLAGALGVPCWLLLPDYGTDWRWMEERGDSPWYPDVMRLFRQSVDGDWDGVMARVVRALDEWVAAPASNPSPSRLPAVANERRSEMKPATALVSSREPLPQLPLSPIAQLVQGKSLMHEQSKAAHRRFSDGAFQSRYFVGEGVDIGGKPDPLSQYCGLFARMAGVRTWDLADGDAQMMAGVVDETYDFVHSSHCLEHMHDVREALKHWIRIVKPGGFLVITVPDEDLYEHGQWPSRFNADHKWSFTIHKNQSKMPRSINVIELLADLSHLVEVERVDLVRDFFREALAENVDQTLTPVAECAIEFVLRKRQTAETAGLQRVSPQTVFNNLKVVRDAVIPGLADDIPHGVVVPLATYSPWRNDKNFLQAYTAARNHTLVDQYRAYELWQLVGQVRQLQGDVLEVGVWRGGTAVVLGKAMQHFGAEGKLFLADTFAGVVKAGQRDTAYKGGEHADTSVEAVTALLTGQGIANSELLKGIFPDETASPLESIHVKLCHIDVDVYQSARDVFEWVWPRLAAGGVVVFDDYGFMRCEGVTRLVNELADRPDLICIHNLNGHAVLAKRGNLDFKPSTVLPQASPLQAGGFNAVRHARHGWMLFNQNDTHLGALIDTYGEFSEGEVSIFQQYVKAGATVVECGANIGALTLPLSRMVGETGKVLAFEPQRIQFQTLCANMALNSVANVVCLNQAVSDVGGSLLLPPYDPYQRQSSGSLCLEGYAEGESAQQITLDSLQLPECHFIKADVEGMEEKVLRGARQTIQRCKPVLYVENDRADKSASLEGYIRELGYEIHPHAPPLVQESNYFGATPSLFKGFVSLNLLCLPK